MAPHDVPPIEHGGTIAEGSLSHMTDVGELPRQTTLLPAGKPQGAAAGPIATGVADAAGAGWDPVVHESPPRRNSNGAWAKKRGNGARKAKGLPNAGAAPTGARPAPSPIKPSEPTPGAAAPPPAAAFASGSTVAPDPVPGESVLEGDLETPQMLSEADYQQTGETLTRAFFGLAQLTLDGKAWEPSPAESKAFSGCLARVWMHYGFPRLGPLTELAFLIPPTFAKRKDEPKTKKFLGRLAGLLWWRRSAVVEIAPQVEPAADPIPPPASRGGGGSNPQSSNPRFRITAQS